MHLVVLDFCSILVHIFAGIDKFKQLLSYLSTYFLTQRQGHLLLTLSNVIVVV